MDGKKVFRYLWLIALMLIIALGCSVTSGLIERELEKALETEVGDIVTEVEAIMTDVGGEGVFETMEAEFTDIPLFDFTDIPFFDETEVPGTGEKPADIPVMEGSMDLSASSTYVEYAVEVNFNAVVDFYEREMPVNGWTKLADESRVETEYAKLVFSKDGRKAEVVIEPDFFFDGISVSIEIEGG